MLRNIESKEIQPFTINLDNLNNMTLVLESNKNLQVCIDETKKNYHTIDVNLAMKNLSNVSKILKLAYAGSKGFPCSNDTIEILSKHQTMIKNSHIATTAFVNACLTVLKYHKFALVMAEKNKLTESFKMISKCSEMATSMAEKSGNLANEAKDLVDLSRKALKNANNDETLSKAEKEKIKKMIDESVANEAKLKAKIKSLYDQINEQKEELARIQIFAFTERIVCTIANTVGKIVNPISGEVAAVAKNLSQIGEKEKNKNNEHADMQVSEKNNNNDNNQAMNKQDSYKEQEIFIMKLKAELQKEEREANADIARIGQELISLKVSDNDLSHSIYSLQLAIRALGKIQTTFEHTRQFWIGIQDHCKSLVENQNELEIFKESNERDLYIENLKQSALNWLALGRINYDANLSIKHVDNETDDILCNLPIKDEALKIIKVEGPVILKSLQDESSFLE
jgi:hypothetical protein